MSTSPDELREQLLGAADYRTLTPTEKGQLCAVRLGTTDRTQRERIDRVIGRNTTAPGGGMSASDPTAAMTRGAVRAAALNRQEMTP